MKTCIQQVYKNEILVFGLGLGFSIEQFSFLFPIYILPLNDT